MRRRAEPCRTFLVTPRMYARTRMRARGIGSQGNRFGRYGRFGTYGGHPALDTCWMRVASLATTVAHVATCCVLVPSLAKHPNVGLGPTGANVAYPPGAPPALGPPGNSRRRLARGNRPPYRQSFFCLSGFP